MLTCPKYKKVVIGFIVQCIGQVFISTSVYALENDIPYSTLEEQVSSASINVVIIGTVLLILLAAIALTKKRVSSHVKKLLFISIAGVSAFVTLFLAISTIYLNITSHSKGPVHHHADFEIIACGKTIDLKDPQGLSNKIGTPTLHEHNDFRIHLEGVVVKPEDQSVGKFFHVIGGDISGDAITVPTNNGIITYKTGDLCPDGSSGQIQAFVYKTVDGKFHQEKVENIAEYIYSNEQNVPPGDCIIIEFGTPKQETEAICTSYKAAEKVGRIRRTQ